MLTAHRASRRSMARRIEAVSDVVSVVRGTVVVSTHRLLNALEQARHAG
jgi:hypothetical protein